MDDASCYPVRERARWPRRGRRLGLVLVIFGLAVAGIWIYRWVLQREIAEKLRALQKAGYPVELGQIPTWRASVSSKANGADAVLEAIRHLSATNALHETGLLPERNEPLSPDLRRLLKEQLADDAKGLELAHQAARFETAAYPIDWSKGFDALLPHLSRVKRLCLMLRWKSLDDCDHGDTEAALQDLEDILAVARTLEDEPLMISQLVRLACIQHACGGLERLLNQRVLSEPQILKALAAFNKAERGGQGTMARAMAGERCLGINGFSLPLSKLEVSGQVEWICPATFQEGMPLLAKYEFYLQRIIKFAAFKTRTINSLKESDLLWYLETMDLRVRAAEKDFPEALDQFAKVVKIFEADSSKHGPNHFLAAALVLPMGGAEEKAALGSARLRLCQAALTIEQFRLSHGDQPPEKFEMLVPDFLPALPKDPFDGKPLRYLRLEKGYRLYSIGRNRKDDWGEDPPPLKRNRNGRAISENAESKDVLFTVDREQ